jgi:hypothetical protein
MISRQDGGMSPAPPVAARPLLIVLGVLLACLFVAPSAVAAGIAVVSPTEGQVVNEGATVQFSFRKDGDWTVGSPWAYPPAIDVQVYGVQTSAPLTFTASPDDPRLYLSNSVALTCSTSSPCRQLASVDATANFTVQCSADCESSSTATATSHFKFLPTPPAITTYFAPTGLRQGGSTKLHLHTAEGATGARDVVVTWAREGAAIRTETVPLSSQQVGWVISWSPQSMQAGRWRVSVADKNTNEALFASDFIVAPPTLSILFNPANLMVGLWAYTDIAIAAGQTGDRPIEVTWLYNGVAVAGGARSHTIRQSAAFYTRDAIRPNKAGAWTLLVTDWTGTVYTRNFTVSPKVAPPRLGPPSLSNVTRAGRLRQVVRVRTCGPAGAISTKIVGTYRLGSRVIARRTFPFSGVHRGGCRVWTYSWNVPSSWFGVGRRTFRVQTTDRFGQPSNATTASFVVAD